MTVNENAKKVRSFNLDIATVKLASMFPNKSNINFQNIVSILSKERIRGFFYLKYAELFINYRQHFFKKILSVDIQ